MTRTYGEGEAAQTVLSGINLEIRRGEFASLIGSSGSGKSTLLNIAGALDRPSTGTIRLDGVDLNSLNDRELATMRSKTLGFIFQFHFLLPEFTVLENVLIPAMIIKARPDRQTRERARELLDLVGLSHRLNHRATNISGGEQQRAAIARALMNEPRLVLADEPTGNLDSHTTEKVFALLRDINREACTSFLLVTHDRRLAIRSDRIIAIRDGAIELDMPTEDHPMNQEFPDFVPECCLTCTRTG